jgi:hypothetical protein
MAEYNHTTNAGNEGDVPKHLLLIEVLSALLGQAPKNRPFWYFDSHAARPIHDLAPRGNWKNGLGKLRDVAELPARIRSYVELAFHAKPGFVPQYLGSSAIAALVATQLSRRLWVTVCDVDRSVCIDLYDYFTTIYNADPALISDTHNFPQIWELLGERRSAILHGNGYEIAHQFMSEGQMPDLLLVDPPTISDDRQPTERLLLAASNNGVPFLCWTPLTTHGKGGKTWQDRLSEDSKKFLDFCSCRNFSACLILWREPNAAQKPFGCQLTFSRTLSNEHLREVCSQLESATAGRWKAGLYLTSVQRDEDSSIESGIHRTGLMPCPASRSKIGKCSTGSEFTLMASRDSNK